MDFHGLSWPLKLLIPAFRQAQERPNPEMSIECKVFTAPFPMHQGSKLRNWIAQQYSMVFHGLSSPLKWFKPAQECPKGIQIKLFTPRSEFSIDTSKVQNEIAKQRLNRLTRWKLILKATIYAFQMHSRTLKMSQNILKHIWFLCCKCTQAIQIMWPCGKINVGGQAS